MALGIRIGGIIGRGAMSIARPPQLLRLMRTALQSVNSATETAISWDTLETDAYGVIPSLPLTLLPTPSWARFVRVIFSSAWSANLAGQHFRRITVGGISEQNRMAVQGTMESVMPATVMPIGTPGVDTVSMNVYHEAGAARNLNYARCTVEFLR